MSEQTPEPLSEKEMDETIHLINDAFLWKHPCREIKNFMKLLNISEQELAVCLGITIEQLQEILNQGRLITENQAIYLEIIFEKPAKEWMEMQDQYVNEFLRVFDKLPTPVAVKEPKEPFSEFTASITHDQIYDPPNYKRPTEEEVEAQFQRACKQLEHLGLI